MFFKGTERRPTSRDLTLEVDGIGGEFNAFTSQGVHGLLRPLRRRRTATRASTCSLDMLRNSKFDPEEIEREKGVILEEMNMYHDTPRDHVGTVYEELIFGDNPLGWETLGTKETIRAATRDTFLDYVDELVHARPHGRRRRRHGRRRPGAAARGAARRHGRATARRRSRPASSTARRAARSRSTTRTPTRRTSASASRATRSTIPTGTRCSCSAPCSAAGCRRGSSSRCASAAGSPTTSTGCAHSYTDAGTLVSQAGVDITRIDEAITVIADQFRRMADEPVPADELEKARSFAKGRFVLQTESPQGLMMFGLRREVLEGGRSSRRSCSPKLDAVTAEDVQRVAQDLIARQDALHLAVIGPFDDPDRFRALLD